MLLDDCVALNLFVVVVEVGVVVGLENIGGPGGPADEADGRGKDAPKGGRGAGGGCGAGRSHQLPRAGTDRADGDGRGRARAHEECPKWRGPARR